MHCLKYLRNAFSNYLSSSTFIVSLYLLFCLHNCNWNFCSPVVIIMNELKAFLRLLFSNMRFFSFKSEKLWLKKQMMRKNKNILKMFQCLFIFIIKIKQHFSKVIKNSSIVFLVLLIVHKITADTLVTNSIHNNQLIYIDTLKFLS